MPARIHAYALVIAVAILVLPLPRLTANDQARTVVKRAVLVGINDYSASSFPRTTEKVPDRQLDNLEGAVTDVRILRELLVSRYGFEPGNIITLTDQQASRKAILSALDEQLIKPSKRGDVALFYYSGHGSQVVNSR